MPLITMPLGPWEPDKNNLDAGVLSSARNVLPGGSPQRPFWQPLQSFQTANFDDTVPDATNSVGGLFIARRTDGKTRIIAGTRGDPCHMYAGYANAWELISTTDLVLGLAQQWQFAQFGSDVYISSLNSGMFKYDAETGAITTMTAVAGAPAAKYLAVVGPFLVAGQDKNQPAKTEEITVKYSGIENPDEWTVGTDLCDEQVLPDGGYVTGIVSAGGMDGYIVQEAKIRRMVFQPGAAIAFRFETVEERKGAIEGYTVVSVAGTLFYLSYDGFYSFGPQGLQAIGEKRVNQWFYDHVAPTRINRTQGFVDTASSRVGWAFYSEDALGIEYPNRIIYYDWQLDRWSYSTQFNYAYASGSYELAADAQIGYAALTALSTGRQLTFQNGPPEDAQMRTERQHLFPGQRSFVSGVYPVGDFGGDTVTVTPSKAETPSSDLANGSAATPSEETGMAHMRSSGRIHSFSLEIAYDEDAELPWKSVESLQITATPDGRR